MKRSRLFVTLLSLALLLGAACGDDDGTTASPTADPPDDGSTSPTAAASASSTDGAEGSPSPTLEPSDTDAAVELTEFSVLPGRTSARPGTVTFNVSNIGELTHEFLVIRTDLPHAELPRLDSEGADESQLDVVGFIDPIDPGDEAELEVELESGNYVLICNLFSDSTSHYLSGMYNRFTIADTASAPESPTE